MIEVTCDGCGETIPNSHGSIYTLRVPSAMSPKYARHLLYCKHCAAHIEHLSIGHQLRYACIRES